MAVSQDQALISVLALSLVEESRRNDKIRPHDACVAGLLALCNLPSIHSLLCLGKPLLEALATGARLLLVELDHGGDHAASPGGTLQEMGLEHVLAVVARAAVVAFEGPIEK